jgi:hypothetical protein
MSSSSNSIYRATLPPGIRTLLSSVRFRIRRDALLTGLLLAVSFGVIVFWATTILDVGWFLLQRLELPVGLRAVLLALLLPSTLWLLATRVLLPTVRRLRDLDVALLLERHFPQFQDRLITSVETAQGLPDEGPLSRPMLNRSIQEAEHLAGTVAAEDIFDAAGLKRLCLLTGGLLLSVVVVALTQPQLITRWWSAFIQCDEVYHQRTTDIRVIAIAQPGDRRMEFQQSEEHLQYRHPRGADLELDIFVPDGGPSPNQEWVIPERVRVDVVRADGSRSRTYVSSSASSPGSFRFVITRLQEPIEIELLAGDYRTRHPYRVEIVNSPGLDTIRLSCSYPDYTQWNSLRERDVTVTGSEVQLPVGTLFQLTAQASKPLRAARIVSDEFELSGDQESSILKLRDGRSVTSTGAPLILPDGSGLTARFSIVLPANDDTAKESQAADTTAIAHPDDSGVLSIPASANLRFFLHDNDDVMSASPETLRVQGIPDKPPVVVAQMTGIDTAVTRLARIPLAGRIRDDYGLQSAGFLFLVDDESGWRPRTFSRVPERGVTEFSLQRNEQEAFEVFDLQPLELSEGQTLTLSITASDANEFPGPGITRSEPMVFRVVSIEELLSLLYTREIALRTRFEEVIVQLEEISSDLTLHETIAGRVDSGGSTAAAEDRASLNTCATRCSNSLRRQMNELKAIVEGFEEIVRQLINNQVPPQTLAENMRSTIVAPLRGVSDDSLPQVDRVLGGFRVAVQDGQPSQILAAQSGQEVRQVIAVLKQILENVRDMAEFHEALRDLKAILDEQQKNLDQTRKLQKTQLLDDLLK